MNKKILTYPKILILALLLTINLINLSVSHAENRQPLTDKNNKQAHTSTYPELDNIKKVLNETVLAINSKNIEKISPYLSEDFTLISLENIKITPRKAFLDYWDDLFKGAKATIKKFTLEIQIDSQPVYMDSKIAILQGTAIEGFTFFKGDDQILHTRWTAILEKRSEKKNEWIITAIHHSSGITKSMLNTLQSQLFKTALGGLVIGLVLGMLIISSSKKTKNR